MKKLLALTLLVLTSCAASKAANQPESVDLSVLKLYNTRVQIIGEFGTPANSEVNENGFKVDTFSFVNGYNAASRAARSAGHAVASVATLGLWEIAGTPIEGGFNGSKVSGQAVYNKSGQAIKLEFYEDGKLIVNAAAEEFLNPVAAPDAPVTAPTPTATK
jgi:hypothetical protein